MALGKGKRWEKDGETRRGKGKRQVKMMGKGEKTAEGDGEKTGKQRGKGT